jgi:hypothetical protein
MHGGQAAVGAPALDPVAVDAGAQQLPARDMAMLRGGDPAGDVEEGAYTAP